MSARNAFTHSLFTLALLPLCSVTFAVQPPISNDPPLLDLKTTSPAAGRRDSVIQDAQWALNFKLRSATAPAFVELRERLGVGEDIDLLILEDPDDCLDLSHADPIRNQPIVDGCPGGPDEIFVRFRPDPFEVPGVIDSGIGGALGGCSGATDLTDTPVEDYESQGGAVSFNEATKSYALSPFGSYIPIGPSTASFSTDSGDCYGYGADDDLRGLVVMSDIGGAQMFDTDLTYDSTRIRNMAGLLSRVGYELLDKKGRAAITADLAVTNGMLEPVVFVDNGPFAIGGAGPTGYLDPSFQYRIAAGPVQTVQLMGSFTDGELLDEILAATSLPYTLTIRSVLVDGAAPNFVDDLDGNGVFNKDDLTAAGYTLLSNQSRIKLNVQPREFLRVEEDAFECPRNLTFTDLNGDGVVTACADGDGTSRSAMRVPR